MKKTLLFILIPLMACSQEALKVTPPNAPESRCDQLPKSDLVRLNYRFAYLGPQVTEDHRWYNPSMVGDSMYNFDESEQRKPWENADSAACLREAALNTPRCSATSVRSPDQNCRRFSDSSQWMWGIARIQRDQKNCSLNPLYEAYKNHSHSRSEVAAQCAAFVAEDPTMVSCLEENREELVRMAKNMRITTPSYGEFEQQLLQHLGSSMLWDPAYDQVFDWLMKNYYPSIKSDDPTQNNYGPISRGRLELVRAYRQGDREAMLRLIAETSKKGGYYPEAFPLLHKLGLKGDEYDKLKKLGTMEKHLWSYAPENHEKMVKDGYGPPDYPKLKPSICSLSGS